MSVVTNLRVVSLAERPDLASAMLTMESTWPAYVRAEPLLVNWAFERHAEHQLVVLDGEGDDEQVIARAASVPFAWDGDLDSLPDTGWDEVLRQSMLDTYAGRELTAVCALEIAVVPGRQDRNLSSRTLVALNDNARRLGFADLVAPVRPSNKHAEPHVPITEYATRTREDGLPADAWLRVHVREGGQVVRICPASMAIAGSLAQWREWTGLPFDTDGPVVVPGALTPVEVNVAHDRAVYVEPNVWIRHRLGN
ncbi:N-acetyltransferase [Actinophytocola sp. NPDC049390]|uniref:N-acetyltransferase n=1 Tax=Actinophytocola sp. NPDC049390 TaxID=3363894 RepID=UPI00378770BF